MMAVACFGALGAVSRYAISVFLKSHTDGAFPWGTLTVNVIGCFLMGCLAASMDARAWLSPTMYRAVAAGFLGGLTTFSAFSIESLELWQYRGPSLGLTNLAANLLLGLLAAWVGLRLFEP